LNIWESKNENLRELGITLHKKKIEILIETMIAKLGKIIN